MSRKPGGKNILKHQPLGPELPPDDGLKFYEVNGTRFWDGLSIANNERPITQEEYEFFFLLFPLFRTSVQILTSNTKTQKVILAARKAALARFRRHSYGS